MREANREYGLTLELKNFSHQLDVTGFKLVIWGTPWAISHDGERGDCLNEVDPSTPHAKCPVSELKPPHASEAYLTLPTACEGPLTYRVSAESWQQPGMVHASSTGGPDEALTDCESLSFNPEPRGVLSTDRASSPTGYDFTLDGNSAALLSPQARASSQIKKAVLTLPEGMTVNPSVAAGLGTCSEAQFAAETVDSAPGAGCPNVSKVGDVIVESPIVEGPLEGSMFFATPRENRFGTLLALYIVAKAPDRGLMVKVAGRVDADPGDRAPDHDLRRPAAAALLALQRPLPRRPAQPARDAVGMRQLRHRDRHQPLAQPGHGPAPVLALHPHRRDRRRPLARAGSPPSFPGPRREPRTRTPPPTPRSTCT